MLPDPPDVCIFEQRRSPPRPRKSLTARDVLFQRVTEEQEEQ
jgi:hypothetical protein